MSCSKSTKPCYRVVQGCNLAARNSGSGMSFILLLFDHPMDWYKNRFFSCWGLVLGIVSPRVTTNSWAGKKILNLGGNKPRSFQMSFTSGTTPSWGSARNSVARKTQPTQKSGSTRSVRGKNKDVNGRKMNLKNAFLHYKEIFARFGIPDFSLLSKT